MRSPRHRMLIGRGYYLNQWKNRVIVFIQRLKMSPAAINNWELILRLFNEIKLIHFSQSVHQYLQSVTTSLNAKVNCKVRHDVKLRIFTILQKLNFLHLLKNYAWKFCISCCEKLIPLPI